MKKLTEMQQTYVDNRAAGLKPQAAAVAAGYSSLTADRQAVAMEKRADIKSAIAKARKGAKAAGVDVPADEVDPRNKMPKDKYDDPIVFLTDMMNHKHLPIAMRADAAKQLMPYKHARIGEKGKKDSTKERADKISNSRAGRAGKPKFATQTPPPMTVINGGKS